MAEVSPTTTAAFAEQEERMKRNAELATKNEHDRRAAGKEEHRKQSEARAARTAQAANVMEASQPTPTQEENDLAKLGVLHPDDKVDPKNPEMPTLYEQQRAAEAGGAQSQYRTREALAKPAKKPE